MLDLSIDISQVDISIRDIVKKISTSKRISDSETLTLFNKAPNSLLFSLANAIREKQNGNNTFFNKNIHIEPTNICVFDCKFCSYSRLLKEKSQGWEHSIDEMVDMVKKYKVDEITEGWFDEYGQWEKTNSSYMLEKKCKHCGWIQKKDYK